VVLQADDFIDDVISHNEGMVPKNNKPVSKLTTGARISSNLATQLAEKDPWLPTVFFSLIGINGHLFILKSHAAKPIQ